MNVPTQGTRHPSPSIPPSPTPTNAVAGHPCYIYHQCRQHDILESAGCHPKRRGKGAGHRCPCHRGHVGVGLTCHHLRRRHRGHMMYVCNFNRQLTCMWRRSLQVVALFPVICDERLRRVGTARVFFKARFRTHTSLCEAWVCESLLVIDLVQTRPTSLSLSLSLSLSISLSLSLCFILAFYDTPVVALRPSSTTREPAIRRAQGRRELASVREGRVWFVLSFGGLRGYDTQRVRVFPVRVAKCWHVSPSRLAYRHRGRYFQQKPRLRVLAALALAGQKLAYLTCVVYNNDTYR